MKFDGTSYYRAYGVFPHLKKLFAAEGKIFEVHPYNEFGTYSWADILPYDIIFLQRPSMDASKRIKFIDTCKKMGKKIWVDFDDNLFWVPMENRVFDDMTKEVKEAMYKVLTMADLITVSTPALKYVYVKLGIKTLIEVVPNGWDFDLHGFAERYNEVKELPPPQIPKIKYVWRGSETHQGDLASAGEAILKAASEHEEKAVWNFMGYNPWMITENMPVEWWTYNRGEDIFDYFRTLKGMGAQVLFFPLRDNPFNHCKSNIAWMEATFAGAVCIAPDWPEWQKPGVYNYKDDYELEGLLSRDGETFLLRAAADTQWQLSASYIRENLSLDVVNKKRKQLLENI